MSNVRFPVSEQSAGSFEMSPMSEYQVPPENAPRLSLGSAIGVGNLSTFAAHHSPIVPFPSFQCPSRDPHSGVASTVSVASTSHGSSTSHRHQGGPSEFPVEHHRLSTDVGSEVTSIINVPNSFSTLNVAQMTGRYTSAFVTPSASYSSKGSDKGLQANKRSRGSRRLSWQRLLGWMGLLLFLVVTLNFISMVIHMRQNHHSSKIIVATREEQHAVTITTEKNPAVLLTPPPPPEIKKIDVDAIVQAAHGRAREAAGRIGDAAANVRNDALPQNIQQRSASMSGGSARAYTDIPTAAPYLGHMGLGIANPFPDTPRDGALFRQLYPLEPCTAGDDGSTTEHCEHSPHALGLIRVPNLEDPAMVAAEMYDEHRRIAKGMPIKYPLGSMHQLQSSKEDSDIISVEKRAIPLRQKAAVLPLRIDVVYTVVDPSVKSFRDDKLTALRRTLELNVLKGRRAMEEQDGAAAEEMNLNHDQNGQLAAKPTTVAVDRMSPDYMYYDPYNDTAKNAPYEVLIAESAFGPHDNRSPENRRGGTPREQYRDQFAEHLWEALRMRSPTLIAGGHADVEFATNQYLKSINASESQLLRMLQALTKYEAADRQTQSSAELQSAEKEKEQKRLQTSQKVVIDPRAARFAEAEAIRRGKDSHSYNKATISPPSPMEERLLKFQADEEANRYRDFNEFKASLRATFANLFGETPNNTFTVEEKQANKAANGDSKGNNSPPLMRYVFIVVAHLDQIPRWLCPNSFWTVPEALALGLLDEPGSDLSTTTTSHLSQGRRIIIVEHRDLLPDTELPSFNSYAIETSLFRIPGLSRHFIYFNNDMVVARPASWFDYFSPVVMHKEDGDVTGRPVVRWLPTIYHDSTMGAYDGIDATVRVQIELLNAMAQGGADHYGVGNVLPAKFEGKGYKSPALVPERLEFFLSYAHMPALMDRRLVMLMLGHPHIGKALTETRKHTTRQEGDVFLTQLYVHFAVIHRYNLDVKLANTAFHSVLSEVTAAPRVIKVSQTTTTATEPPPETFFGGLARSRRDRRDKPVENIFIVSPPNAVPLFDSLGRRRVSLYHHLQNLSMDKNEVAHSTDFGRLATLRGILDLLPTIVSAYTIEAELPVCLGLGPSSYAQQQQQQQQQPNNAPLKPELELITDISLSRHNQGSTDHWLVDFLRSASYSTTTTALSTSIRYYFHMGTNQENMRLAIDDLKPRLGRVLFVTFNDDLGPSSDGFGGSGGSSGGDVADVVGGHIINEGSWVDGSPLYAPFTFMLSRRDMLATDGTLRYIGQKDAGPGPNGLEFGFFADTNNNHLQNDIPTPMPTVADPESQRSELEAYNNPNLISDLGVPDPALYVIAESAPSDIVSMTPHIIQQMIKDSVREERIRKGNQLGGVQGEVMSPNNFGRDSPEEAAISKEAATRTEILAGLMVLVCRANMASRHARDLANAIVNLERQLVVRRYRRRQLAEGENGMAVMSPPLPEVLLTTSPSTYDPPAVNVYGGEEMVAVYKMIVANIATGNWELPLPNKNDKS